MKEVSHQRRSQIRAFNSGLCTSCFKKNSDNAGAQRCLACTNKQRKLKGIKRKKYVPNMRLRELGPDFWKKIDLNRPTKEIAAEHEVVVETAWNWKRKAGIKMKRGRPRKDSTTNNSKQ